MATKSAVDQLVKSLAFVVEATPQENPNELASTSNTTPLNLKIRVRKKSESDIQHGMLSVSKPYNSNKTPEKIRLISSDQTIMSFNVLMEADLEKKPKRKPRRYLFGGCLGTQYDEEDEPYLPFTSTITESNILSKSEGVSNHNLITSKSTFDDHRELASIPNRQKYNILGKCKPGGCLDPPFNEDKYPYKPKECLSFQLRKDINNETVSCKEDKSILSIYEANCYNDSVDTKYSDSIITYPPEESSRTNFSEQYMKKKKSSEEKPRQPIKETAEIFFSPLKISSKRKSGNTNDYKDNKDNMVYEKKMRKDAKSDNSHDIPNYESSENVKNTHALFNSVTNTKNNVLKQNAYNKENASNSNLESSDDILDNIYSETKNQEDNTDIQNFTKTTYEVSNILDIIPTALIKQSNQMHKKKHSYVSKPDTIRKSLNLNAEDDCNINYIEDLPKRTSIPLSMKTDKTDLIYDDNANGASLTDLRNIRNLPPNTKEVDKPDTIQTHSKISRVIATLPIQIIPLKPDANDLIHQNNVSHIVTNKKGSNCETIANCENLSSNSHLLLESNDSNSRVNTNNNLSLSHIHTNNSVYENKHLLRNKAEETYENDSDISLLRESNHESKHNNETILDGNTILIQKYKGLDGLVYENFVKEPSLALAALSDSNKYIQPPSKKEINELESKISSVTDILPMQMLPLEPDSNDLRKQTDTGDIGEICDKLANEHPSPRHLLPKTTDSDSKVKTSNNLSLSPLNTNVSINENENLLKRIVEIYGNDSKISMLRRRESNNESKHNNVSILDENSMDLIYDNVAKKISLEPASLSDSKNIHALPPSKKEINKFDTTQIHSEIPTVTDTLSMQVFPPEPKIVDKAKTNDNAICEKSFEKSSLSHLVLESNDSESKLNINSKLTKNENEHLFQNKSVKTYGNSSMLSLLSRQDSNNESKLNNETIIDAAIIDSICENVTKDSSSVLASLSDSKNIHTLPSHQKEMKQLNNTQKHNKISSFNDTIPIQMSPLGPNTIDLINQSDVRDENKNKDGAICETSCENSSIAHLLLGTTDSDSKVNNNNKLSISPIHTNDSTNENVHLFKNHTKNTDEKDCYIDISTQRESNHERNNNETTFLSKYIGNSDCNSDVNNRLLNQNTLNKTVDVESENVDLQTGTDCVNKENKIESASSSKLSHDTYISNLLPLSQITEKQDKTFHDIEIETLGSSQNLTSNSNEVKEEKTLHNLRTTSDIQFFSIIHKGHVIDQGIYERKNMSDKSQASVDISGPLEENMSTHVLNDETNKFTQLSKVTNYAYSNKTTNNGVREANSLQRLQLNNHLPQNSKTYSLDQSEKDFSANINLKLSKEDYQTSINSTQIKQKPLSVRIEREDGEQRHSNLSPSILQNNEIIPVKDTLNALENYEIPVLNPYNIYTQETDKNYQIILSKDIQDHTLRLENKTSFIAKDRENVSENVIQKTNNRNYQNYKEIYRNTSGSMSERLTDDSSTNYINSNNNNTNADTKQSLGDGTSLTNIQYKQGDTISSSMEIMSETYVATKNKPGREKSLLNHDAGNQFLDYISSPYKHISSQDNNTNRYYKELSADKKLKKTQVVEDKTNENNKCNDPGLIPKGTLKKDIFTIDIGFQSYINNKKERVIRTFDTSKVPPHYSGETITKIQSQIRQNSNVIHIPVDSDHDMSIQIKRFKSPLRVQIQENDHVDYNNYFQNTFDLSNNPEVYVDASIPGVSYQKNDNTAEIQTMLNLIYEKDLLPLHKAIMYLKQEVETLNSQQNAVREKPRNVTRMKPILLNRLNQNCGCRRK